MAQCDEAARRGGWESGVRGGRERCLASLKSWGSEREMKHRGETGDDLMTFLALLREIGKV